jgi:ABC-type phosphate/phosphonate transport system substrate-binding protein
VTVDTVVAEHTTTAVPTPERKANTDRSDHSKIVLRGDVEKTAPAPPSDADHLVAILMVRTEIKSVSDLANKNVAIDDWQSASASSIRTAIVAAGAAEVQISEGGKTLAIDRVISGEVPAAVLTLVSPEAAETWPQMTGFKIFRIPLDSSSSAVR